MRFIRISNGIWWFVTVQLIFIIIETQSNDTVRNVDMLQGNKWRNNIFYISFRLMYVCIA